MIRETGTVVAIEPDCLWVETIQKTTCGSCAARQGCGQHLMSKITGKTNRIRVLLNAEGQRDFALGDSVSIGIPEAALVSGAALVYLLPVAGLIIGSWIGHARELSETATILLAGAGLAIGAAVVRLHSWGSRKKPQFSPVVLDDSAESVKIY